MIVLACGRHARAHRDVDPLADRREPRPLETRVLGEFRELEEATRAVLFPVGHVVDGGHRTGTTAQSCNTVFIVSVGEGTGERLIPPAKRRHRAVRTTAPPPNKNI